MRIAFIGNSLPRRCGIATFTTDLQQAVDALPDVVDAAIIAMQDHGTTHSYPADVRVTVGQDTISEYRAAAAFINRGGFDIVCLQHEFGIFGGPAGQHILELIEALRIPLVTTLHTVLDQPTIAERAVMTGLLAASSRVIVMAEKGRHILVKTYAADPDKIAVIPHGIPDHPLVGSAPAKEKLGFAGKQVILTFGLISPGKGIELMIDAMAAIVAHAPDAIYVVMGATHPNLIREAGETYRQGLLDRVAALDLGAHVVFLDQFVDRSTLLEHIAMSDVYVTPYLDEAQMTSGTLAYSHGLGRPVVSTPYWHALELLADDTGVLVPFSNSEALAEAVSVLLADAPMRLAMGRKAYQASRPMIWENTARRYRDCFRGALRRNRPRPPYDRDRVAAAAQLAFPTTAKSMPDDRKLPPMVLSHFMALCDDTGLLQHAIHNLPDRDHGYCIDDNARALLLCCAQFGDTNGGLPENMTSRFAAFIQHGWNPDNQRFRNFMSYDRKWLEPAGSEDSHGRTLWALGACTRRDKDRSRGNWAAGLFRAALPSTEAFTSPRAWAFTLLGLDDYCAAIIGDDDAARIREGLASQLEHLLDVAGTPAWLWFENGLAYDNARLSEALIRTGMATGRCGLTEAGLSSLSWLIKSQTSPSGLFRPVGTRSFGASRAPPQPFDQQPVEAAATIAACLAAHRFDPAGQWSAEAQRAFDWFLGANDLAIPLVDLASGSCRDGLHPDRANENRGAESVLSYLLGLADMRALAAIRARPTTGLPPLPSAILPPAAGVLEGL